MKSVTERMAELGSSVLRTVVATANEAAEEEAAPTIECPALDLLEGLQSQIEVAQAEVDAARGEAQSAARRYAQDRTDANATELDSARKALRAATEKHDALSSEYAIESERLADLAAIESAQRDEAERTRLEAEREELVAAIAESSTFVDRVVLPRVRKAVDTLTSLRAEICEREREDIARVRRVREITRTLADGYQEPTVATGGVSVYRAMTAARTAVQSYCIGRGMTLEHTHELAGWLPQPVVGLAYWTGR